MPLELNYDCPYCDAETFYRSGSTRLHLGEKVKWNCTGSDCEHGFVRIGTAVDSSTAQS